jgi:serine/threonine protein kinase
MPLNCSRCQRQLSDSADPAELPMFCTFCGCRLRNLAATEKTVEIEEFVPLAVTVPPKYQTVRHLGSGGMGEVYEAVDTATGEHVAIKFLADRLAAHPASVEQFRNEGRLARFLSHPHCVRVLDVNDEGDRGQPFIAMELMPGRTLKDLVESDGPLAPEIAIRYILDAIEGLIEAHRLKIIHRDVKPSNCFLTEDDRVKIGDFGLSNALDANGSEQGRTGSNRFSGTVLFAPPEQIRGEPVGFDSDIYSVCATLYYLLSGRTPHQAESITAALAKAISEPPTPLRRSCPGVSVELERIVMKGLERDRSRRWSSLEELRSALQAARFRKGWLARFRALFSGR